MLMTNALLFSVFLFLTLIFYYVPFIIFPDLIFLSYNASFFLTIDFLISFLISCLFCIICINIIFSRFIIFSALMLIFFFILAGCCLIALNVSFLGFSLLIVYVGAIAILIIFVIMLLDIKISDVDIKVSIFNYSCKKEGFILNTIIDLFFIPLFTLLSIHWFLEFLVPFIFYTANNYNCSTFYEIHKIEMLSPFIETLFLPFGTLSSTKNSIPLSRRPEVIFKFRDLKIFSSTFSSFNFKYLNIFKRKLCLSVNKSLLNHTKQRNSFFKKSQPSLANLFIIGQAFYTSYFVPLLLIGFTLFISVIGSLFLTVSIKKKSLRSSTFKQVSRRRFASYRKSKK